MEKLFKNLLVLAILSIVIHEIQCDKVKVVNLNTWSLTNQNATIQLNELRSPIGVYTALKGLYGDIIDSKNDESLRWIAYDNWTFSTHFSINFDNVQNINLTLYGIDTISTIYLNGIEIGKTDNMFVRYSFNVLHYLQTENVLEIHIKSPVVMAKALAEQLMANGINTPPNCPHSRENGECHRNMLRKMQTSFGGDWSLAAPSMGIWKPVDLEYYEVAIMRDVDVAIRRNDTHWTLDMRVFLSTEVRKNFYAELTFIAAELLDSALILKQIISYNSPKIEFVVHIPKDKVSLWWPNGYGKQKLYPLYFSSSCWQDTAGPYLKSRTKSQKTVTVGFRTIELEEDLDGKILDIGRSFYFKVNDQPIFIKGANYVPSHVLPEQSYKESRVQHILKSAKESHLNLLRVWGGGLYESNSFYNMTDYYGLLVWQDMTFSGATYPLTEDFVDSVRLEASQNAQRLAYHPSLCMLATNDEIELYLTKTSTELGEDSSRLREEYKQLFMGTIKYELNVISRNDFNPRAGPMISTPSMGVEESKKDLSTEPQNINYGDVHFWEDEKDGWDPDIYPRARFITEYGFQSLPILSSWNRTIYAEDSLPHIVQHRQHDPKAFIPMLQLITRHFALPAMDWDSNVDALIYLSQVSQAMATKTATDLFRSQRTNKRTMGAIYWQLNDAWVAPTWSSIDYFGNYKIVWYWSKQFMAPTSIIALIDSKTNKINVTVTKEEMVSEIEEPELYNITMKAYLWSELYYRKTIQWQFSLRSNGIYQEFLDMSAVFNTPFTRTNCFLKFELSQQNTTISTTHILPGKIASSIGIADPQLKIDLSWHYCDNNLVFYTLTITVRKPALFVYLEIYHPQVSKYKLSENGFILVDPIKVIHLEIELMNMECITLSEEHVRVMTVNQLLFGGSSSSYTSDEDKTKTTTPAMDVFTNTSSTTSPLNDPDAITSIEG